MAICQRYRVTLTRKLHQSTEKKNVPWWPWYEGCHLFVTLNFLWNIIFDWIMEIKVIFLMSNHSPEENISFWFYSLCRVSRGQIFCTQKSEVVSIFFYLRKSWLLETETKKTCQHNGSVCAALSCFSQELWIYDFVIYEFWMICRIIRSWKGNNFIVTVQFRKPNISQMTRMFMRYVFRICCNKLANWEGWTDTHVLCLCWWNETDSSAIMNIMFIVFVSESN